LSGPGSPIVRRRELGALLRDLRTERGWTVEQVASRLMCSPSKVSRMETGRRGVSARDIRDIAALYELNAERRQQLADLAAEGKEQAWYNKGDLRVSDYIGLESAAETISDFGLGLVPGLLQTPDYASTVLRVNRPSLPDEVIADRLASRLERQHRLLLSDRERPRFEALIDEAVLHRVVGSLDIMRGQLQWLVEVSRRPNILVRLLRYEAGALPSNTNKFVILTFGEQNLPDVVLIESLLKDQILDAPHEVAVYEEAFGVLRNMAASPEQTRELAARVADTYGH
jgi:transcriptional regulator with XRE-family HTH domain